MAGNGPGHPRLNLLKTLAKCDPILEFYLQVLVTGTKKSLEQPEKTMPEKSRDNNVDFTA